MRKLIFSIGVTMDGFMDHDKMVADQQLHDFAREELASSDLILFGRVTYGLMVSYWPIAPTDPDATPDMVAFANTLNPMHKFVYSKTLPEPGWNTELRRELDPAEIARLKQEPGKDILVGSSSVAAQLINLGLVDEVRLRINPLIAGAGKPTFKGVDRQVDMKMVKTWAFDSGVVVIVYQVING